MGKIFHWLGLYAFIAFVFGVAMGLVLAGHAMKGLIGAGLVFAALTAIFTDALRRVLAEDKSVEAYSAEEGWPT